MQDMSQPDFFPFSENKIPGATIVIVFAILSVFSSVSVAARVIWLAICRRLSSSNAKPREYVFFNTQLGHYAICLLIANMLSSTSGVLGVFWLSEKGITAGIVCTIQAITMQTGNWATAYFTITIAAHTFNSLVLRIRRSVFICATTICIGWIMTGILVTAPFINHRVYRFGPAYGPDGLSCGVRSVYPRLQFFFHLFPIFLASALSAILCSIVFLVFRGTLKIKGGVKLVFDPSERWVAGGDIDNYHRFVARIARNMLWYPIAYIALLLPYSVVRLLVISGFVVSFEAMIFAYACWFLLGVVNVVLLYNTFRVLGPAFQGSPATRENESFGTTEHFIRGGPSRASRQSFSERGERYHYATPRLSAMESSSRSGLQTSVSPMLPTYQKRAAAIHSFYSYPSSPQIGRSTTLASELNQSFADSTSQGLSHSTITGHAPQASTDSFGLPAPPRHTRSQIVHQQPSLERVRMVNGAWTPTNGYVSRQTSNRTFGRPNSGNLRESTNFKFSVDLGSSGWHFQHPHEESSLPLGGGRPMLSAFSPAFPVSSPPQSPPTLRLNSRSLSAVPISQTLSHQPPATSHRF